MVKVVINEGSKVGVEIKKFNKKVQREGILRDSKIKQEFEKPCERRKRKLQESASRKKRKSSFFVFERKKGGKPAQKRKKRKNKLK